MVQEGIADTDRERESERGERGRPTLRRAATRGDGEALAGGQPRGTRGARREERGWLGLKDHMLPADWRGLWTPWQPRQVIEVLSGGREENRI